MHELISQMLVFTAPRFLWYFLFLKLSGCMSGIHKLLADRGQQINWVEGYTFLLNNEKWSRQQPNSEQAWIWNGYVMYFYNLWRIFIIVLGFLMVP